MRRRKLFGVAVLALVALLAVGAFVLVQPVPPSRLTMANCMRLREGMMRAEVEAILGAPGDYRTGPTLVEDEGVGLEFSGNWLGDDTTISERRECDGATVKVEYRTIGTISVVIYLEAKRQPQNPLDFLLWRTKRQWRKWFPE
jgi:hypothetical protein